MSLSKFRTKEDQLQLSEGQGYVWIDHSPVCTKIVDLDLNLQFMSSAGVKTLAMSDVTEYYGKPYPFDFYPQSFCDEMSKNLSKARDTDSVVEQEAAVVDTNGNEVWFHSTIFPVRKSNQEMDCLIVVSIDTTEQYLARKALETLNNELEAKVKLRTLELEKANKQLHYQAETDFLTKLPNRFAFDRRVEENIATAIRNNSYLSLLMIDIDNFKSYNDEYGHDTGDIILKKVAQTIADSLLRKTDFAARYGGEEFVILLPDTDINSIFSIAEKVRTNIQHSEFGKVNSMTVSIGIASLQGNELNATDLLKRADKALYMAKNSGRNNSQIFHAQ